MSEYTYPSANEAQMLYELAPTSRKYDNLLSEVLDSRSDCESDSFGDVERGGYYQLFVFDEGDGDDTYGAILRTNNDGFVTCEFFDTQELARESFEAAQEDYYGEPSEDDGDYTEHGPDE
jgi:hypothetical protein